MAGIGFVLRKLANRDDYIGVASAYVHSAMVAAGPWLLTILSLGAIVILSEQFTTYEVTIDFRSVVIYNFAFSLVFSGPIFMVVTRYLSDEIYKMDVSHAPGLLLGALFVLFAFVFPVGIIFYSTYATMSYGLMAASIVNFILINGIWVTMVFLSALKNFKAITWIFFIGICIASVFAALFAKMHETTGMLFGFNTGIAFILFSLIASIFSEYPYRFAHPFLFFTVYKKYWKIAIAGVLYNAGVWVDKWIMWTAPEAVKHGTGLITFPFYDTAMFLAFLTVVPVMALFIFSVETNFFETYILFFRQVQKDAPYHAIEEKQYEIVQKIFENGRNFLVIQGSITLVTIFIAPSLFDWLKVNYLLLGIFRMGVLGALFNVLILFITVFLSYFDSWNRVVFINGFFLASNACFTFISKDLGFLFYGYGYALASMITFLTAGLIFANFLKRIPYHIFVTNNLKQKLYS